MRSAIILAVALLALAHFVRICRYKSSTNFLPGDRRAEWVIFPTAIEMGTRPSVRLDTTFRRQFTLPAPPQNARVLVRAAKHFELKINGLPVDVGVVTNWKHFSTAEITGLLRSGVNTVEARVFNVAPPAFWMALTADQMTVRTDSTWEASLAGSAWRPVARAVVPRFPGPGNLSAGGETTGEVWPAVWPIWLLFAVIAGGLWLLADRWWRNGPRTFSKVHATVLLGVIALLWIALFWNNGRRLPVPVGFDVGAHVDYIKYVQERRALPYADEGFEMFHPPLFYATSAAVLSAARLSTDDASAVILLRLLTMLFGLAQVCLVFFTLRLLFPSRPSLQVVGVVLAGFLPMQIYMGHNVTNETMAAALMTATIYVAIRWWRTEREAWTAGTVWVGVLLGAALLTKATAVLLVPPLFTALFARLIFRRPPFSVWLRTLGVPALVAFAVCGWHYLRIWRRFGHPLVGNWDVAAGFAWWQDPGFRTVADYFRFGRSLSRPLLGPLAGYWDGLYSTLWGDGLWGGLSDFISRTPWNYSLVVGGYLLALAPTLLILTGIVVALRKLVVRPTLPWFLLLAFPALIAVGLAHIAANGSYAAVKAVYGLAALIPLCCFGALGFHLLSRGRRAVHFTLSVLLLVWAANSYISMWIRESAAQHVYNAARFRSIKNVDAALVEATRAVKGDPADATAQSFLSSILAETGRPAAALEHAERAVQLAPRESGAHEQLSRVLLQQGEIDRAMEEARTALKFGPENTAAHALLLSTLIELRRDDEALEAGREALAIAPFIPELHYSLGTAAGRKQEFVLAAHQFVYALLLRPNWAEARPKLQAAVIGMAMSDDGQKPFAELFSLATRSPVILNDLAWLLATHPEVAVRNGEAAVTLAEQAMATKDAAANPTLWSTTAAAYAEVGRFEEAIAKAEQALALARYSGNEQITRLSERLLTSFRAGQPHRDLPE